jgi:ubiquinone/menaquinone biosynthesis C-methylase UbiE
MNLSGGGADVELQHSWQFAGNAPDVYERYKVPSVHGPVAARLLERIPLRPGQRVLDVACGTGIVARLAAPRVAPTGTVTGIDLHEGMLAVARACAGEAGAGIEWRECDGASLPFADASFDVVTCSQGLQFFPDKVRALREMWRVVAAGGTLALGVFGVPSAYTVALAEALATHAGAGVAARSLTPYSLGNMQLLRRLASDAFGAIEIQTVLLPRRIEPTQEWLLQDTEGTPYGSAIAGMVPAARAEMIREIGAKLAGFWDADAYSVPREVHLVYARK